MDKYNRPGPAVEEVATSDDTATVTHVAALIPSSKSEHELEHTTHVMKTKKTARVKHIANLASTYNDEEFKYNFGISRSTFSYILGIINPKLDLTDIRIPPEEQLLMTLLHIVTPTRRIDICNRFRLSQATLNKCINRVIKALYDLAPSIITWPSGDEVSKIWKKFEDISHFPKVIGVLGSTHITIQRPRLYPHMFCRMNKGDYSVHLQLVCDHKARFIYCGVFPGSILCHEVFHKSDLKEWLGKAEMFPTDCHILGDIAYKLHKNVIVPYLDNGHLSLEQQNFNIRHSETRMAVKRAFSLLKTRFRSMNSMLRIDGFDPITHFVFAVCVIHNICLYKDDKIDYDLIDEEAENTSFPQDTASPEARDKRNSICETLPMCNI